MTKYTYYIGLILLALLIYVDISYLYRYMSYSLIEIIYSFSTYIGLIAIPVVMVTGILLVYFYFLKEKLGIAKVYNFFWVITVLLTILLYYYFEFESQKLSIIVMNVSSNSVYEVEIRGRNGEGIKRDVLRKGDRISFICNCRKITHGDSTGINLMFAFPKLPLKNLEIVSLNKPEYRSVLNVQIINDTLTVVNSQIKDQWIRLERPSYESLYNSKELESLIRK